MWKPPLISLLTDFGTDDAFVGVMKGVIAGICPDARVVDVTHAVPRHNIAAAAFHLAAAFPYFPEGTIHVVVVDPGVGSGRKVVAMASRGHIFIAPDNGVLTLVERGHGHSKLVEATNKRFFLPEVSATFHGRDVFAPVAAHVAGGLSLDELGPAMTEICLAPVAEAHADSQGVMHGVVLWSDRFGNLITNIPADMLEGIGQREVLRVRIGNRTVEGLSRTYADAAAGEPLAMIGSFGHLEIAVRLDNAAKVLDVNIGAPVQVAAKAGG